RQRVEVQGVLSVLALFDPDKHAGTGVCQCGGHDPRALERLPAHFQQETLARIERLRLARRDAEERRIERIDVSEECALARVCLPGHVGVRIVVSVRVPSAFWNWSDRIRAY